MRRFRVFVKDKFEAIYDTIDKARECRRALQSLKYENIIIKVEDIDAKYILELLKTFNTKEK